MKKLITFIRSKALSNSGKYIHTTSLKSFSIYNPNSLMFKHKLEMDNLQKQRTRMRRPEKTESIKITEENDFEPGLDYFEEINEKTSSNIELVGAIRNPNNNPENGWVQFRIPFDKELRYRKKYELLKTNRIRHGKLMEILDYLSAFSAYRHNNILPKSKTATMVTASMDSFSLKKQIDLTKCLLINAYPTWTGDSSMEIRLDIYNGTHDDSNTSTNHDESVEKIKQYDNIETDENFLGSCSFVYVARNALNYKEKKKILPLDISYITDESEKAKALLRQEMGHEHKKVRIKNSQQSLFKSPPTQEETAILHEQFVFYKSNKNLLVSQATLGLDKNICDVSLTKDYPMKFKTISETKIEKFVLMHSQNMNVNGHVFGGYIMRQALELGYVCVYMHSNNESPSIISVDSVTFHKPVIIGSVAQFSAYVSLVHEELAHVCVEVTNHIPNTCPVLTTTINITYKTKNKSARVFPTSYECGVKYLEAQRIIQKLFDIY